MHRLISLIWSATAGITTILKTIADAPEIDSRDKQLYRMYRLVSRQSVILQFDICACMGVIEW